MKKKKSITILSILITLIIGVVLFYCISTYKQREEPREIKTKINFEQQFIKYSRYNSFWMKFIDSLIYKDTIIESVLPQPALIHCSNNTSYDFNDWLNNQNEPEYYYKQNMHKKLESCKFPFLYIRIIGVGGGNRYTYNGTTLTPFTSHLLINNVFGKFRIIYWSPIYFPFKEKYNISEPGFDILCFEADNPNNDFCFEVFWEKAKNNKYLALNANNIKSHKDNIEANGFCCSTKNNIDLKEFDSVLIDKIIQVAKKSELIKFNRIKIYDQTSNIELLVEFDGNYSSLKNFIFHLCDSNHLFVVKLVGIRNSMFRPTSRNTASKYNLSKLRCVLLIQFPICQINE